jgi:hypothetical protein
MSYYPPAKNKKSDNYKQPVVYNYQIIWFFVFTRNIIY